MLCVKPLVFHVSSTTSDQIHAIFVAIFCFVYLNDGNVFSFIFSMLNSRVMAYGASRLCRRGTKLASLLGFVQGLLGDKLVTLAFSLFKQLSVILFY